jgi:hypothetical protein
VRFWFDSIKPGDLPITGVVILDIALESHEPIFCILAGFVVGVGLVV